MHSYSADDNDREAVVHADDLLPSLAQQVRAKRLDVARGILWVLGALIAGGGIAMVSMSQTVAQMAIDKELTEEIGGRHNVAAEQQDEVRESEARASRAVKIMGVLGTCLGIAYLFFGAFVKRYPAAITILALVMFIASNAVLVVLSDSPGEALVAGWIWKIGIMIALAKSIHCAIAFELERLHQERRRQRRLEEARRRSQDGDDREEVPDDQEQPPIRRKRRKESAFQEDARPIKTVLWFFGLLLVESILYGMYIHFGDGLAAGGKEEMEQQILEQMLVFDVFSSLLVIVAVLVSGRPPPIRRPFAKRLGAWGLGLPVLILVLGINILYGKLLQEYVGKHPHLEVIQLNFQNQFWLVLFCICIQPAVIEELFFRYLALGHLRRVLSDHSAIWVSSVMFGFAHLHNPIGMPVLILCGAAFGYMRVKSGGMLLPMAMHGLHNAAVTLLEGVI